MARSPKPKSKKVKRGKTGKWTPELDPAYDSEKSKYASPIPSRDYLIQRLTDLGRPMTYEDFVADLGLTEEDALDGLRRRLNAMCHGGQLARNRRGYFGLINRMDLLTGRVQGHRDGYGFFIDDEGGEDLFLNNRQMSTVFDGDRVLVRKSEYSTRGKTEAVIVEVIESAVQSVVGRFYFERGIRFVEPDNQRISHQILITEGDEGDAKPGDYVVVAITQPPGWRIQPVGRVIDCLGGRDIPGVEVDVAIRSYDIPFEWSQAVLSEAQRFPVEPDNEEKRSRVDLRDLPLVTIDGEDARDFDDAVYCEPKRGGGWRLWVAIADVSHYVQCDSALDEEASKRGTSVYFPQRVVPMLPENLSNGLCSLNPQVDRLCMVCEMTISAAGKMSGYTFYEGVMNSHARLTYDKVAAMLVEGDKALREQYAKVLPHLQSLYDLYKTLLRARGKRGAIDFDTTETQVIFNAEKKIETIVPRHRNDAHRLIEECMLCANVAAARFLEKHKVPALYRVHQGPSEKKLGALHQYLGSLGLSLDGGDDPSPKDYQNLLASVATRDDRHIIQVMMLRSMSQARYQEENEGHFGLHYAAYAHFTSPIRRYPDLLVHRAIRSVIRSRKASKHVQRVSGVALLPKKQIYPYDDKTLTALGEHCSMAERRADDATRDVLAYLKCEYLSDRVGEVFTGVVAGVTSFGLFVELDDLFVEGLIHVSSLQSDYYHFDSVRQRMQGERSGHSFEMGDRLAVRLVRVDLDDRKIDLVPEGEPDNAGGKKTKGRKPRRGKSSKNHKAVKSSVLSKTKPKKGVSKRKRRK